MKLFVEWGSPVPLLPPYPRHTHAHTCGPLSPHSTHSYEVREAQLRALNATPAKVSYKLVTGPMLSVLEAWLVEGDADQQH
eukprot:scaffold44570_cov25-Tisochrysis_lutea.AAC.3